MENGKKIIIAAIVFVVLVASLLTVLRSKTLSPRNVMTGFVDSGKVSVPATEAPGRMSLGMPVHPDQMMAEEPTEYSSDTDFAQESTEKKVIKNGNLNLKVGSTNEAVLKISQITRNNQGEVFSSNFSETPKNIKSGNMTVKVPVANFERTFNEIKEVASLVVRESTSGQDVTEQYTDLQSQLKNKQAEEAQFVIIMEEAKKIQDILDVTKELSRVRGEIERLQGKIRFMDSQTDMASIFISLSEDADITAVEIWRPWQIVKDSVNLLIKKAQEFVNFSIVLVITVVPIALLYFLLVYVVYKIGRRIYVKIKNKTQQ